jgi:hypothetical protein
MPHQVKHRKRPGYTNPPQVGTRVDIVWRDQDGAEVLVPAVYLSSFPAEDGLLCVLALDLDACAQNRIFSPSLMAWLPRRFSGIRVGQLRKREK